MGDDEARAADVQEIADGFALAVCEIVERGLEAASRLFSVLTGRAFDHAFALVSAVHGLVEAEKVSLSRKQFQYLTSIISSLSTVPDNEARLFKLLCWRICSAGAAKTKGANYSGISEAVEKALRSTQNAELRRNIADIKKELSGAPAQGKKCQALFDLQHMRAQAAKAVGNWSFSQGAYQKAICHWKLERYQQVILDCTEAIARAPFAKAYARRSKAHEQLGDLLAALRDAQQYMRLVPEDRDEAGRVAALQATVTKLGLRPPSPSPEPAAPPPPSAPPDEEKKKGAANGPAEKKGQQPKAKEEAATASSKRAKRKETGTKQNGAAPRRRPAPAPPRQSAADAGAVGIRRDGGLLFVRLPGSPGAAEHRRRRGQSSPVPSVGDAVEFVAVYDPQTNHVTASHVRCMAGPVSPPAGETSSPPPAARDGGWHTVGARAVRPAPAPNAPPAPLAHGGPKPSVTPLSTPQRPGPAAPSSPDLQRHPGPRPAFPEPRTPYPRLGEALPGLAAPRPPSTPLRPVAPRLSRPPPGPSGQDLSYLPKVPPAPRPPRPAPARRLRASRRLAGA
eukprot:tig00021294_g20038.t1